MDGTAVVIGAGSAGLACAGELKRAGIEAIVLEREDTVGASWRKRYDRLRLNSSKWLSKLPDARYGRRTAMFPTRDQMISYLETYADDRGIDVRTGTTVDRIDRQNGGWVVHSSGGDVAAPHVLVATGYQHTPVIPDWPGRDSATVQVLHAAEYRNPEPFRGQDVLVVGPGCSGMEIAYDLTEGGAERVRLAVRTPPNIVLRKAGPFPSDPIAVSMMRVPPKLADRQMRFVRRAAIGNLAPYGLPVPDAGLFARMHAENKVPAIVDPEVIKAIKKRRFEIVPAVDSLDGGDVVLADGERIAPDVVIAATGYRPALEGMVGHLGVLDERGMPRVLCDEAAPGLRFIGFIAVPGAIRYMGREAKRAAAAIAAATRP